MQIVYVRSPRVDLGEPYVGVARGLLQQLAPFVWRFRIDRREIASARGEVFGNQGAFETRLRILEWRFSQV
jgi:hypothetical protein